MVVKKKNRSRSSRKLKSKVRKSRKTKKSKKNMVSPFKSNISGYVHQIKCKNNICSEYKQQINSLDDFFNLMRF